MTPDERRHRRMTRPSSGAHPAKNTLDRATATMPRLFRARMDDFGLDFSIVYPTFAFGTMRDDDEDSSLHEIMHGFLQDTRQSPEHRAGVAADVHSRLSSGSP
ncbi:MAG: hypothetical protein ACKVQU_06905 [Burkholderiales bacterium]